MSTISKNDFIAGVKKCAVIEKGRLKEWLRVVEGESAQDIAAKLIRDQLLTKWQAKYLMSGRTRLNIGSYQLLERIQRDELGDRFLALHTSLARKVALQVLPAELTKDETRCDEFMRKASLAAKLDHPNLIHVYDIDREGGRLFLVTEHVEGTSLDKIASTKLGEIEIASLASQVIEGIRHAHENNVIHGCISQSDLVLTDENEVKIQNLTVSPLRQVQGKVDNLPSVSDDFGAISNISVALLNAIPTSKRSTDFDSLAGFFADFDPSAQDSVEGITQSLAGWLESNAGLNLDEMAGFVLTNRDAGGFDQPIATTNVPKMKKPQEEVAQAVESEEKLGVIGRIWNDNPVALIATAAVMAILLIGSSAWGALSFLGNSGDAIARKGSASAGNRPPVSTFKTDDDSGQPNFKDVEGMSKLIDNLPVGKAPPVPGKNVKPKGAPASAPSKTGPNNVVAENADAKSPTAETLANNAPAAGTPDVLSKISGIGEKTQTVLVNNGVTSYKQLAAMSVEELQAFLKKADYIRPGQQPADWIAQAKEFSADTSPVTTAAATPAPAKTPGPFVKFPRMTDLPPVEKTDEVKLADLVIKKQYLLGAELISEPSVCRTKLIFEIRRTPEDKQKWVVGVKRREKEKPTDIAYFRKSESAFHFQWLPEAEKNKYANFLRNCYLKLILPEDQATFLTLRKPVKMPDLRLTDQSLTNSIEVELPWLPDLDTIVIEVLPLRVKGVVSTVAKSGIEKGMPSRIWLKKQDKTGFLWLQVAADFRSKLKLQSNLVLLKNGQTRPVKNLKELVDLANLIRQNERIAVSQNQLVQARKSSPQQPAAELKKIKQEFQKKAQAATAMTARVVEYGEVVPKILNQPVSVRIYAKLGKFQTILAVTDPTLYDATLNEKK